MWVTKLLISPVKKKNFCPKTTKFSPKLAFMYIVGSFGGLVGGCGAGCISQDTYLLYVIICIWKGSLSILVIYYGIKSNELFASSINEARGFYIYLLCINFECPRVYWNRNIKLCQLWSGRPRCDR